MTKVKIKKHHHGRYGLKSIATIPQLASGQGSITQFRFKIDKKFRFKHHKRSILTAKCPDGRLQAHAVAFFTGGPRVTDRIRPALRRQEVSLGHQALRTGKEKKGGPGGPPFFLRAAAAPCQRSGLAVRCRGCARRSRN